MVLGSLFWVLGASRWRHPLCKRQGVGIGSRELAGALLLPSLYYSTRAQVGSPRLKLQLSQ